ncbi:DNA binding protein [Arthrobacter phage Lizalica]|uniref:DNA binding protein n=1 Tax=Arthrobacter phage Lizalica TaxID=2832319 RepID=A0AA48Y405_9CAUD|nr:DNA binding protein [Arthrobacter phage Lizalica]UIW13527.1 DNA binding protein [Arthrobacter phage Lizalica]
MSFNKVLADIFDRNVERRFESVEEEVQAIELAKKGDEKATIALMYAYSHALNAAIGQFRYAGGVWADGKRGAHMTEDLRSLVTLGFLEAVNAYDPEVHHRLAAIITQHVREHLSADLVGPVAFTVPQRTLTRFYSILRKAGGDPVKGAAIAKDHSMTVETFMDVLAAVRTVNLDIASDSEDDSAMLAQWEAARPVWDRSDAEEDTVLVETAFAAVDDVEESVCRLAYGFESYGDPVPDIEIGHRLGMTRPTVQRRRSSALGKMRKALAAE